MNCPNCSNLIFIAFWTGSAWLASAQPFPVPGEQLLRLLDRHYSYMSQQKRALEDELRQTSNPIRRIAMLRYPIQHPQDVMENRQMVENRREALQLGHSVAQQETARSEGEVRETVWKPRQIWEYHQESEITAFAVSHDGVWLAIGTDDGIMGLWSIPHQKRIWESYTEGSIRHLVFDRQARMLIAAVGDGTIRAYRRKDGQLIWQTRASAQVMLVSPDDQYLAFGQGDGEQVGWIHLTDGKILWKENLGTASGLGDFILAPNGADLIVVQKWGPGPKELFVLSSTNGQLLWKGKPGLISPDAQYVAYSGPRLVRLPGGSMLWQRNDACDPLAFSPDGRFLACDCRTYTERLLRLYDMQTGTYRWEVALKKWGLDSSLHPIHIVAFSPDMQWVAAKRGYLFLIRASDGQIVWQRDMSKPPGKEDELIEPHEKARYASEIIEGDIKRLEFTPDSQSLLVWSGVRWNIDAVARVDRANGHVVWKIETDDAKGAVLTHGGRALFALWEHRFQLWELTPFEMEKPSAEEVAASQIEKSTAIVQVWETTLEHDVRAFQWTPDGRHLLVQGKDVITVLDAKTGHPLQALRHANPVMAFAISPDGQYVASSEAEYVRLWNLQDGLMLWKAGSPAAFQSLGFTRDGRYLMAGASRGIAILRVADGRVLYQALSDKWLSGSGVRTVFHPRQPLMLVLVQKLSPPSPLFFVRVPDGGVIDSMRMPAVSTAPYEPILEVSPDGHFIALWDGYGNLEVWRLDHRRRLWRIELARGAIVMGTHPVRVAFSPDGRFVLTGTATGPLQARAIDDGSIVWQGQHRAGIYSLACSPDGRWVAAGSALGVIRVWQLAHGKLLGQVNHGREWMKMLGFAPDSIHFVTVAGSQLRLWRIHTTSSE